MLSVRFAIALGCAGFCFGQNTTSGPTALASEPTVTYCFARVRGNNPERLPPAYLVLQLNVKVTYHNAGPRPLILPLLRERTVYTGLKPEAMSVFKERFSLLRPAFKVLKRLPADVSPDSPVDPKNDVFGVIPAGGDMTPPRVEEVILPVTHKSPFKQSPDLRGLRIYLQLRFVHQKLADALKTDLSDRWSRFGVPWTGTVTTNLIAVDVPAEPQATGPCKDVQKPAHAIVGINDQK
jgi:hypothetical protein